MTQSGSMDPFSTFLNVNRDAVAATSAEPGAAPAERGATRADVLRALLALRPADGGPVPLRDLGRELGVRTTQVAVVVAALDEEGLVTIGAAADDDLVRLTDAGVAAAGAVTDEAS